MCDGDVGEVWIVPGELGQILYLGGFGKRITMEPIPLVESEHSWVWKERLSEVDIEDAMELLSESDRKLYQEIKKVLQDERMIRCDIHRNLPEGYITESAFYRRIGGLVQKGYFIERKDGTLSRK